MEALADILDRIENSRDDMVRTMIEMIRIPALAPVNGGDGESKKADYLMTQLKGFDSVERIDVPDDNDPSVMRSNIVARKNGKKKGTVWVMAHMDVVPAGDPELWDNPPFDPVYKDGRVYGRGTEDNGQSIVSTLFASRFIPKGELNGMSLGVVYVADEETASTKGICYLLDKGYFSEDDVIMVPDWGSPNGSMVEVAEKSILWLKFQIHGKTSHASAPQRGINAYRVSTVLLMDLLESLPEKFGDEDDMFRPSKSTFEPTKRPATVENINTIPGYDEFYMDIRLVPEYDPQDVIDYARKVADVYEKDTGAKIDIIPVQCHRSGKVSSTDTVGFKALSESIESVVGHAPTAVGVGGGTCANFFRDIGLDAYVWQVGGGSLHAPNEYVVIDNLMTDAKVFATLYYKLCVQ